MSYTNIMFDLYGTLVDIWTDETRFVLWKTLAWQFCLHQADYTPKELKEAYFRLVRLDELQLKEKHGEYAEIDLMKVFMKLFELKNAKVSELEVKEMMLSFRALSLKKLKLYDGIEDLLKSLKEHGKKLYLLTNAQRVFTEQEIVFLGLNQYFDGILYSSDAGIKKPDAGFYEMLIHEYQLDKNSTVMIGNDALCDVEGALNAGIHAFFLESNIKSEKQCPSHVKKFKIDELKMLKNELIQN